MIITVTGGSASGKSEYAENVAVKLNDYSRDFYYVATMKPFDEECEKRIKRHQILRLNKGFVTKECYEDLSKVCVSRNSTVLLECMSNLVANVMYGNNGIDDISEFISCSVEKLANRVKNLVIVTNEVFSDGIDYDEETQKYIKVLGEVNRAIAKISDSVIEVVYTIPVAHKGKDILK